MQIPLSRPWNSKRPYQQGSLRILCERTRSTSSSYEFLSPTLDSGLLSKATLNTGRHNHYGISSRPPLLKIKRLNPIGIISPSRKALATESFVTLETQQISL